MTLFHKPTPHLIHKPEQTKPPLYQARRFNPGPRSQVPKPEISTPTPDPTHDETHHPAAEPGSPILTDTKHKNIKQETHCTKTRELGFNDRSTEEALEEAQQSRIGPTPLTVLIKLH